MVVAVVRPTIIARARAIELKDRLSRQGGHRPLPRGVARSRGTPTWHALRRGAVGRPLRPWRLSTAVLVKPLIGDSDGRPRGGRVAGDRGQERRRG